MNAFFTGSITAWADYCESIGREDTYAVLAQTTEYLRDGDAESAVRVFTECIQRYKKELTERV